jgi:hypothetical protein
MSRQVVVREAAESLRNLDHGRCPRLHPRFITLCGSSARADARPGTEPPGTERPGRRVAEPPAFAPPTGPATEPPGTGP